MRVGQSAEQSLALERIQVMRVGQSTERLQRLRALWLEHGTGTQRAAGTTCLLYTSPSPRD
eukprot:14805780-Alexandrium_andersonii.AAC.1